jgi:hypothetical protein
MEEGNGREKGKIYAKERGKGLKTVYARETYIYRRGKIITV